MAICLYCGKEKRLIKAHIMPKAFFEIDNDHPIPLKIVSNRDGVHPKRSPEGIYDKNILCKSCDQWMGKNFDEYAVDKLLRAKPTERGCQDGKQIGLRYAGLDLQRIKRFIISMVWRSDISSNVFYNEVQMGPWSDKAKSSLSDQKYLDQFSVALAHFNSNNTGCLNPHMTRFDGVNTLVFYFSRFVAYIKIDKRNFPATLRKCCIEKTGDLLLATRDFEQSKERMVMKSIVEPYKKLFPLD